MDLSPLPPPAGLLRFDWCLGLWCVGLCPGYVLMLTWMFLFLISIWFHTPAALSCPALWSMWVVSKCALELRLTWLSTPSTALAVQRPGWKDAWSVCLSLKVGALRIGFIWVTTMSKQDKLPQTHLSLHDVLLCSSPVGSQQKQTSSLATL